MVTLASIGAAVLIGFTSGFLVGAIVMIRFFFRIGK